MIGNEEVILLQFEGLQNIIWWSLQSSIESDSNPMKYSYKNENKNNVKNINKN